MSVPSKIYNIQLVQIQPEERLAATSELNLASSLVTGCGEANGRGYWAATQVKGLSPEINGKIVQMTLWELQSVLIELFKSLMEQLIVPLKRGNAHEGKGQGQGQGVEPLGQGHIHRTERRVNDGNKTGLITYPEKDREVLLKSRLRENLKSGSVRVLIAASERRWL
jgi:hypothetical protein